MAHAETIENVRDNRGRGPLHTCHMKSPWSFHTWRSLLTHTISTDNGNNTGIYLHHLHHLQGLYLPYTLRYLHPAGLQELQTFQHLAVLTTCPPFNQREDHGEAKSMATTSPGGESASDSEDHQDALNQQDPPLDLLPQNEHPSWGSQQLRTIRGEEEQGRKVRTVATQLRTIADEFNSAILHQAHAAPKWQDWRDVYRGLLNFITQTLNTLCRIT